ncbi:hypothetical protein [Ferrimonas futtsuensis]|uniref:hypothetical protein n=1 Tax=Ferrimonas futtsuensis TaxID=364764 RepID=UPI0012F8ACA7|nr:hypothetical protein [Ferrimonas futtsuensis]
MKSQSPIEVFEREFQPIVDKFKYFEFSVEQAKSSSEDCVWHPGVYVWVSNCDGVLRVGRSLTNSRKRALEHIRDNTGGVMAEYGADAETRLCLFNVREPIDYHWVAALEIFLEKSLEPKLKAGRQG